VARNSGPLSIAPSHMSKQKIIEAVEKLSEKDLEKFSKILNESQ
jgi:galactokinase